MNCEYEALVALLRRTMAGEQTPIPPQVDWAALQKLAASHGLTPLCFSALREEDRVPEEILRKMQAVYNHAIYMDTQFLYLRNRITQALTAQKVKHIFLKGGSLKYDYPESALRTMSDLDVLVYAEDFERIRQAMEALDGIPGHSDGNHRCYRFPGGAEVEFHPNLVHQGSAVAAGINPGWQYAKAGEGWEQELTPEGFYLNVLCHLADHFAAGGVGVRFVLDVWVCRHRRMPQPDRVFVERELERFGLLEFTKKIEALAEAWFGEGDMTPQLEELGEYIMTSGSHGRADRAMLNAVCLSPGGSGAALLKKVFYPRQELEARYPWAKGKPWLLPAAWTARAWKAVTVHGDKVLAWTKGTMTCSREEVECQREKLERFGVKGKGCK